MDFVHMDISHAHTSWVFHVQIDPARIVSASQDRNIAVWDFSNGEDVADLVEI